MLQKAEAAPPELTAQDILEGWQGTGFAVDDDLAVTQEFASSASFDDPDGYAVEGEDVDGAFSGWVSDDEPGLWSAAYVAQDPSEVGLVMLMSQDKNAVGVALLRDLSESNSALCNLDAPYVDMSVHKFALWTRPPE